MLSVLSLLFFGLFLELNSLPLSIFFMIFMSVIVFFSLWTASGACWYSLIFCLLFVGGILVIFMVVSSLFPNIQIYFPVMKKKFMLILILFSTYFFYCFSNIPSVTYLKSSVFMGGNFISLTLLILCYFFCFIYFISKDKLSLRSFF